MARRAAILLEALLAPFTATAIEAQPTSQAIPCDPLWREAWRQAEACASPIDAGRTKIALIHFALPSRQVNALQPLVNQEPDTWIRAAAMALTAADAALLGDISLASERLREAQEVAKNQNEWQFQLAEPSLLQGQAAIVLMTLTNGTPNLDFLKLWIADDPATRIVPALRVCERWSVQRSRPVSPSDRDALTTVLRFVLDHLDFLQPWNQIELLARLAPVLNGCGLAQNGIARLEKAFGPKDTETLPIERFDMLTDAAVAYAALGDGVRERAASMLRLAEARVANGQTGDARIPWVGIAQARRLLGFSDEACLEAWRRALTHAREQPGYHAAVAGAMTRGAMAATGDARLKALIENGIPPPTPPAVETGNMLHD